MVVWLLLVSAGILAVSGVPGLFFRRRSPAGQWIAAAMNVVGSAVGAIALALYWADPSSARPVDLQWTLPLGQFAVQADGVSTVFLVPMFLISAAGAVYGLVYWSQARHPGNGRKLRLWWGLMTAGMAMVVLARDGVLFLMAWEIMAVAAFFLVLTEDKKPEVRQAAWVYLVATHVGTLCLLGFFALLRVGSGSYDLWPSAAPVLAGALSGALFGLGVVGFGIKVGLMPLHFWLPGAHANAPSHVSAMMSGVLLNCGVYGLVRLGALLPHPPLWWGGTLLSVGALSGILGIAFAAGQRDLKRLLAYSSIENMGIIVMGLGLALMGRSLGSAEWIALGLGGALLHVLNHSLFKPLLFFGAGSVVHVAGTRTIDLMGGLGKRMPETAALFLLGAAAICGLPPLNGFVSELLIYLGLFHTLDASARGLQWAALAAPALALIGAMAVATFVKLVGAVFAGAPRAPRAMYAHDPGPAMLAPMALLAAGCVLIGIAPFAAIPLVDMAVLQWSTPNQSGVQPVATYASLGWVSGVAAVLIALIAAGCTWLWRWQLRSALRRSVTWDCGYVRPSSRMQYGGSSFSQMLIDLLAWVVWPRTRSPRMAGPFPHPTAFNSDVPDPVLDRGLTPAFSSADSVLSRARVFQRGPIQLYLLYVLGILLLLLILG